MTFFSVLWIVPPKNFLVANHGAKPLVNNSLISEFQENVSRFNFLANALNAVTFLGHSYYQSQIMNQI